MNIYEEIYPLNLITNDDNYLELMIFQSEINLVNYKTWKFSANKDLW